METKVTTPVVKGLIISLVLVVFGLGTYFSGQTANKALGYLQYAILIGGVIWACINYSNQMNNNVTFGNVFAHGFKTTSVVTVIMIIYTVLALKVLFPEMADMAVDQARIELEKRKMADDQIGSAINMTQKFMIPFAIGGILVAFLFMGCIASLIGAGVAKKNPQTPFQQAQ